MIVSRKGTIGFETLISILAYLKRCDQSYFRPKPIDDTLITSSLNLQYIAVNVFHQQSKEYIHRILSMYILSTDLLDLAVSFHAEVVSFELVE